MKSRMIEPQTLALSAVCSPMAVLVRDQRWSLVRSFGTLGYRTAAVIEKGGVAVEYSNSKGEQDYGVRLTRAVHPPLSHDMYHVQGLFEVLAAVGAEPTSDNVFFEADQNLVGIKSYLSDVTVWEENVAATTAKLLAQYKDWSAGPDFMRDLASSLADRNPWLTAGRIPTPDELRAANRLASNEVKRLRRGLVIGAAGIGMVVAHYWP
jgi:hypothetical protein